MPEAISVQLEAGPDRVWACALDWPGWTRSGKDADRALAALAGAAPRYGRAVAAAGFSLPDQPGTSFVILHTSRGTGSSAFAPMVPAAQEYEPATAAQARRRGALVAAAWAELDRIAARAPAELRKGPRGGGRDRDGVVRHVLAAEAAYLRKLGVKLVQPAVGDEPAIAVFRAGALRVLQTPSDGSPLLENGWPVRYAARRIAWHVLDHAWEIEDKG